MKLLEKCIATLSESEKKAFSNYLGRKNSNASRQDVRYVKEINKLKSTKTNKEAALRRRIKNELAGFVYLMNAEKKGFGNSLDADLDLAIYLLDHKITKEGWWLLKKVEKKAINDFGHTILSRVYMTMLEYAQTEFAYPIQTIIEKKAYADSKKAKDENLLIELALIKERLHQNKVSGKIEDFDLQNSKSIKDLLRDEAIYDAPHRALSLLELIRSAHLSQRNVDQMGTIALEIYEKINPDLWSENKLDKVHARFQYIIAHSYYRLKDFDALNQSLRSFQLELNNAEKSLTSIYQPKIVALKTASLFLMNRLDEAVEKLNEFLISHSGKISVKDDLNMHLTLVVLLECQGEFKKANNYFLNFRHSDGWCTKKMGAEWVLRKNIIQAMVLFDCGRDDLASTKIHQIIKNSSLLLKSDYYTDAAEFLTLLLSFLENPSESTKAELKDIEKRLVLAKKDQSLKKLSYLAWLKARIIGTDLYSEILSNVGP